MADKYKEYLAAQVLNDSQVVTYRALSRALKVHVNLAKQMLYDFHQKQNARKPGSVHATYLLTGKKHPNTSQHASGMLSQDGEDSSMQSAPFMSSIPEPESPTETISVTSIILVKEEDLEKIKAQLEEVTSIHIYSLEPGPLEIIHLLSVCNQEIARKYAHEDPLENWKTYGTIHNPNVKRRTTRVPAPPVASIALATTSKATPRSDGAVKIKEDAILSKARRGSESEGSRSGRSTPQGEPTIGAAKKLTAKSTLKRDSSDIFKSFAKAKAKPKEATPTTDSAEQSAQEDQPMKDVSEDEYEEDYTPEVEISKEKSDAARKARAEREEKLRQMMEDAEDVPMDDAPVEAEEEPPSAPLDKQPQPQEVDEPEAVVTVAGGRRRGRRRVTKKKTVKDEEGYLVTKEEQVWESFSEDEPEPKKPKTSAIASATSKGKKGAKAGQGNIMSFFTKK
ncbi:hypothetical protein AOQ84DRAFT_368588 [Glonium stellatum]|uniref:DNA polymerase delta subunit 3 n=1 Tax=Glonium stellatum TaxID=574774 RepID=A0A8E2EQW0_9PEZI|nr:hypothetical protein AOQ84DRAFT_368588 [Glonium stellatum]